MLVLVGLLALARFALTLAAWDTAGGFGLMGARRDLMFAVFVEALLLLACSSRRCRARSTDLRGDERTRRPAGSVGEAGALGGGVRVRAGRCSRRPAASRSITPTPTSS